jgi:hypothetical protein
VFTLQAGLEEAALRVNPYKYNHSLTSRQQGVVENFWILLRTGRTIRENLRIFATRIAKTILHEIRVRQREISQNPV